MLTMTTKRKVLYVTGTRADFGLMRRCLQTIRNCARHDIGIVATSQHLSERHGQTVNDIIASGLPIVARIGVKVDGGTGEVFVRPSTDLQRAYAEKVRFYARKQAQYAALRDEPAICRSGERVELNINAGLMLESLVSRARAALHSGRAAA